VLRDCFVAQIAPRNDNSGFFQQTAKTVSDLWVSLLSLLLGAMGGEKHEQAVQER
jgi:hypothetical protein